jgi:hypothetical protein
MYKQVKKCIGKKPSDQAGECQTMGKGLQLRERFSQINIGWKAPLSPSVLA